MRWLRRAFGAIGLGLLAAAILFGVGWGDRSLYPASPGSGIRVYLVSNGFHSGLILPQLELATMAREGPTSSVLAVATRFGHYEWIETGWGEERFYRDVPTLRVFDWTLALRALFWPGTMTVMHIVGIEGDPRDTLVSADLVALDLSVDGFRRLVGRLDASFQRDASGRPVDLGQGLYGPSLFYRATGRFSFANVCNHWTARMLDAAGVPVSPLLATLPRGLVLDLALRSHLSREEPALPAQAGTQ